jgi:hypothetical protein
VPGDKFESIGSNKGNKIAYLENKPIWNVVSQNEWFLLIEKSERSSSVSGKDATLIFTWFFCVCKLLCWRKLPDKQTLRFLWEVLNGLK